MEEEEEEVEGEIVSHGEEQERQEYERFMPIETRVTRRARDDRAILLDDRVLKNLLETEDRDAARQTAPNVYFKSQTELRPYMRKVVVSWLYDVRS